MCVFAFVDACLCTYVCIMCIMIFGGMFMYVCIICAIVGAFLCAVCVCLCAFLGLCMCTYRREVATLTGEPEWDVNMDARVMAKFAMGWARKSVHTCGKPHCFRPR